MVLSSLWCLPLESVGNIQLFLDVATLAKANVAAMAFLQVDVQAYVYKVLSTMPRHLRVEPVPQWQNPALLASVSRPIAFARNCKLLWWQVLQPLQSIDGRLVAYPALPAAIETNPVRVLVLGVHSSKFNHC